VTAGLTAFYTTRLWCVAFLGKPSKGLHPHESPPVMLIPLAVLAVLSVIAGFLGLPAYLGEHHTAFHWDVALTSLAAVAVGISLSWSIYGARAISAADLAQRFSGPYRVLANRYFFDHAYNWYVDRVQQRLIAGTCSFIEWKVLIGTVIHGIARATAALGSVLRRAQTGQVQTYALVFFLGVFVLLSLVRR
jgi:NADH-quinone oxidoreductase subunit L